MAALQSPAYVCQTVFCFRQQILRRFDPRAQGLEPVKAAPGMYARTDSPAHHQEVLDNAADEAWRKPRQKIASRCTPMARSVWKTTAGHPLRPAPGRKAPVIELVFTRLHAGGKFDKGKGGAYSFSGRPAWRGRVGDQRAGHPAGATSHRRPGRRAWCLPAASVVEPPGGAPAGGRRSANRAPGARVARRRVFLNRAPCRWANSHLLRSKAVLMPA